jgi:hypothetical protein
MSMILLDTEKGRSKSKERKEIKQFGRYKKLIQETD